MDKSLTVSTLTHLFRGQKDLFKDLYEQTDYKWKTFPILKFNFASLGYEVTNLNTRLTGAINDHADKNSIALIKEDLGNRFAELIEKLATKAGKSVVVLIDEYGKPIIDLWHYP
ncbi:MAG: AAA family ATPase [Chitinophagales bacterium]